MGKKAFSATFFNKYGKLLVYSAVFVFTGQLWGLI